LSTYLDLDSPKKSKFFVSQEIDSKLFYRPGGKPMTLKSGFSDPKILKNQKNRADY